MNWARRFWDREPGDTARQRLLSALGQDPRISSAAIEAIARVPREEFVPPQYSELAYEDAALAIGPSATISAPSMVAEMLTALRLEPGLRVLEVGLGSGYAAATMAAMGVNVTGLEILPALAAQARANLERTGFAGSVEVQAADGRRGWPAGAPYDRVIASASLEALPAEWLAQVVDGGIVLYPEAGEGDDRLVRVTRDGDRLLREELGLCRFVRMQLD
jgi:protein-L-isoaspartate(D-aspartate) O-methyltransferase